MGDNPISLFHVASIKDSAPQVIGTAAQTYHPNQFRKQVFVDSCTIKGIHIEKGATYDGPRKIKANIMQHLEKINSEAVEGEAESFLILGW